MISLLHPTNPPVNSDVFKVKNIKYGIKQNRNKTWALFPNFPLPLNYLNDFFHMYIFSIALVIPLQPFQSITHLFHCILSFL